jgi:hypothetical protein
VVDALDECEGDDDIRLILQLLSQFKTLKSVRLQVFITSRPETPIRFGFLAIPDFTHQDFVLHEISEPVIQHDISIFFNYELKNIRREYGLPDEWPGKDNIKLLCQRAGRLFIYASTACRFIRDPLWDPEESLSLHLKDNYIGQSPTGKLDEMYTQILTHSILLKDREKRDREKLSQEFKLIVGSVAILFDSLPVTILARLLVMSEGAIHARLRSLHSVLEIPKCQYRPIRLLHPSFRDFLLDPERCSDPYLWIDEKKLHNDIFSRCLELMSNHLRKDMCNLRLPGGLAAEVEKSTIGKYIPLDVQYTCRYWVYHLQQGSIDLRDNGQVHAFLKKHFLHWLEARSLMGDMSAGILMVRTLESMLTVSDPAERTGALVANFVSSNLIQTRFYKR